MPRRSNARQTGRRAAPRPGTCAISACEPRQGRKAAALSRSLTCAAGFSGSRWGASPAALHTPHLNIHCAYQVLARKWRPQRFDDVVGQRGVTQTLRNAIAANRIAQAFVFAGPRGVGKTTTARILARGAELRQGADRRSVRRLRRLRRDRAGPRHRRARDRRRHPHRQVDNVREVIIAGLGDRAGARPLQDLHHRRSPPAVARSRSTRCSSRSRSRRRTSSS